LAPVSHGGEPYVVASIIDITARKRIEERLQWLSLAVEQSPTSVVMTDLEGNIEYVNQRFCEITGYRVEEVRGRNARLLQSGNTPPALYREMWEAITAGRSWHGELLNRKKDGTLYWDAMWVYPIRDMQGLVTRFLALKEDISDRKQAERTIRERDERLRQLTENIAEVVFVMDVQFEETLYISPAYERMWGRSCRSLYEAPRSFLEPIPPEDQEALVAHITRVRAGEDPGDVEFRVIQPDGQVRWALSHAVPVRNEKNEVYRIVGVVLDITRRKEAEASVVASEQRLRTLFETVNLIVLGLDTLGNVDYANPFLRKLTGYGRDEILGRSWFEFLPAAQRTQAPEVFRVFRERLERDGSLHHENALVTKAGEERLIAWNDTVSRDAEGRPTGTLSIGEDITERHQLEQQLRQAQKMESVGRLAGGVAHDFNNILTAIISYSDLVSEDLGPGHPSHGDVAEIRKAGDRAAALTRQLLALSRQQVLEPRVLDLNELVLNLEKMLHRLLGEDVHLITKLETSLGAVKADPGQLEQVIMNLAVNARDAMPNGGDLVLETANADLDSIYAATHTSVVPGHYVLLAVTDTGTGMDEVTKAHLFEPFFTTKERGKGTGLGLSTVYGIVKQSGGYIWVYSEPGQGATFKIYLPRVDEAAEALVPTEASGTERRGTETILVADDNELVRQATQQILTRTGYQVMEAANGAAALQLAADHPGVIHLLITDIVMPEISGRTLAERLQATRPSVHVLYMSGYTNDAVLRRAIVESGAPYLQKPFSVEQLLRKVRDVLDRAPS
jgi:two-component system, cell cycle sensor histidine kinase and response regulator CckA